MSTKFVRQQQLGERTTVSHSEYIARLFGHISYYGFRHDWDKTLELLLSDVKCCQQIAVMSSHSFRKKRNNTSVIVTSRMFE
jgi:hypothetical protein